MNQSMTNNVYFTAQGEQDGKPVVYRSMQSLPQGCEPADFPFLLNIHWEFDGQDEDGMPDQETQIQQANFEQTIASLDNNGEGHLMLVVTGNHCKEWLWYVKDPEIWMQSFNDALKGHEVYPIDVAVEQDADWSTWRDFVSDVKGLYHS